MWHLLLDPSSKKDLREKVAIPMFFDQALQVIVVRSDQSMLTIDVPQNIHCFAKTNIRRPFRGDSDSEKADAYPVDWPPSKK